MSKRIVLVGHTRYEVVHEGCGGAPGPCRNAPNGLTVFELLADGRRRWPHLSQCIDATTITEEEQCLPGIE